MIGNTKMRFLLVAGFAIVAMTSSAVAETALESSQSADLLRLTDSQMDDVTAGSQNCSPNCVVQVWVLEGEQVWVLEGEDGLARLISTRRGECLAACNTTNQQGGNNIVGDQSIGDVELIRLPN